MELKNYELSLSVKAPPPPSFSWLIYLSQRDILRIKQSSANYVFTTWQFIFIYFPKFMKPKVRTQNNFLKLVDKISSAWEFRKQNRI